MNGLANKIKRRLLYDLFLAPRGYGFPVEREVWERQYAEGAWDYLDSAEELAHYMIIVGYVHQTAKALGRPPSVLDLGCGHGRLLELLPLAGFESYHGVDLSEVAVGRAESLGVKNATFEAADFERWEFPEAAYDVVVINEALYYASDPAAVLARYRRAVGRGGVFVISLNRYGNYQAIWQNVGRLLGVVASTAVENGKGQVWDVKLLSPLQPPQG